MELPRGATAVDFAYAVHTDVGNTCVAAKVERRLAPLRTKLQSGQSVEVITAPGARPNPTWLNFVVTGKARATIRHYLKNLKRDESVDLGRRMLEKAMAVQGGSLDDVTTERLEALLTEYKLETLDDLLAEIGLGNRMAPLVTGTLTRDKLAAPGACGIRRSGATAVHQGYRRYGGLLRQVLPPHPRRSHPRLPERRSRRCRPYADL